MLKYGLYCHRKKKKNECVFFGSGVGTEHLIILISFKLQKVKKQRYLN
jgi:hypothetical protein